MTARHTQPTHEDPAGFQARFQAFEHDGWARRSQTYDDGFGLLTAGAHTALLDAAGVGTGISVLEVGCGSGRLTAAALGRGARVTATDAVPGMVAVAAAAAPGALVRQAVLPGLPFPEAAFDAAVGAFVINHVAEPEAAVADLARVLRPGGRVALSCWGAAERNVAQSVVPAALAASGAARPAGVPERSPFLAHSDPDGFGTLLRGAGFREVRVEELSWIHRIDPDRWWRDLLSGTVLTSSLIEGQDRETAAAVKRAYDRLVAEYATGDGRVALPVAALIATGTR
ncbi:class I SAM-dependent methyltransferase [Streptacidiphilus sp. 4-A2]|nr:class I SAM-dependent methyltransferase [Streptacidiphilus sp. 4-A2]